MLREAILENYSFANEAVNLERFLTEHRHADIGLNDSSHPLVVLPQEARRLLMVADNSYLKTKLGVGCRQREAIRELVLSD